MCLLAIVLTLPKIFRPVSRNTLIFLFVDYFDIHDDIRKRNGKTCSMPIHILQYVKHVQKLVSKHGSSDKYAHKRTVNLMHA